MLSSSCKLYIARNNHVRSILTQSCIFSSQSSLTHGKYYESNLPYIPPKQSQYDVIIVGGGHNGLVSAAYLGRKGLKVLVLERRHCIGGAAVSEEIFPGYKFSRASYLAGLLRPDIVTDLELEKHGMKYLVRQPSSFTPTKRNSPYQGKYLLLGKDEESDLESIRQFSEKDADMYLQYEDYLSRIRDCIQPLLDSHPPDPFSKNIRYHEFIHSVKILLKLARNLLHNRNHLSEIYEFMMSPAQHILNKFFESEIVKTTLATDAVVGALCSTKQTGSGYVLLHHIMGEAAGRKGVWAQSEGGMGGISNAIAKAAMATNNVEIVTNASVKEILVDNNRVLGVQMKDNTILSSNSVISACTPYHTFMELLGKDHIDPVFRKKIELSDYSCGSMKINLVVDELPNFSCCPNTISGVDGIAEAGPQHRGTIHFESHLSELETAYQDVLKNIPAERPVIEMTIPSVLDTTLVPPGEKKRHVILLFIQFVPYHIDPKYGSWEDNDFKQAYANKIYTIIDEYCPGFSQSILHQDILSPLDLEKVFGLHQGSISHGALNLHQLLYARPVSGYYNHKSPIQGLYMGSAGCHPGGGVIGASGRNCARILLSDLGQSLQ